MPRPRRFAVLAFPSLLLALAGCAGTGSPGPAEAGPADLVIVDATVFDARSRSTLPHHTVVIEGDRIAAVLPADAPLPEARRAIDARGRLLTPGLIDVHSHMFDRRYFEAMWKDFALERSTTPQGQTLMRRNGYTYMWYRESFFDVDHRLRVMDQQGVDMRILSLSSPSVSGCRR